MSKKLLLSELGFFDESLDTHTFAVHIWQFRMKYGRAKILKLLPECLRYRVKLLIDQLDYEELAEWLQIIRAGMRARGIQFPQEAPQASPKDSTLAFVGNLVASPPKDSQGQIALQPKPSRKDSTLAFVRNPVASPPKDSQPPAAPQASPKDIGFFDPSLQYDFPELRLFHDANTFCDHTKHCRSESGFLAADILELLPKCLRGEALAWFRSLPKNWDLIMYVVEMRKRFPPRAAPEAPQAPPEAPLEAPQVGGQSACQASEYHHCKLCNASFFSATRLLQHTQENVCNKPRCRHCEKLFPSKNRLHQHLREGCQKTSA